MQIISVTHYFNGFSIELELLNPDSFYVVLGSSGLLVKLLPQEM
jgi:hypothetical protein